MYHHLALLARNVVLLEPAIRSDNERCLLLLFPMATSLIHIHHKDNAFFFPAIFLCGNLPSEATCLKFFFKIFNQFGLAEFDSNPVGLKIS